jgi:hypothetical protein
VKFRLGALKKLIRESAGPVTYTFPVYGPDDEEYTVTATYNPRTPFDVEIWKATSSDGQEVDVEELEAQGHDLRAKAFDSLPGKDDDGLGRDWDDFHGDR